MKDCIPLGRKYACSIVHRDAAKGRLPKGCVGRFLILILLLMLTLPSAVQAQFSYTVDNGAVTITGYTGVAGDLTIPGMLEGLPVTGIGDQAFLGRTGLTGVTLPDSLTSLGYEAFAGCRDLIRANLGKGLTNLGGSAFLSCTKLALLMVAPENPAYAGVGGVLFDRDQTLLILYPPGRTASAYAIPDSVAAIGEYAFSLCNGLTNVSLGDQVISIGPRAFGGCRGLTNVTFGAKLATVGDDAFAGCTGLTSITLPQSLTGIGRFAFGGCTNLVRLTVAAGNPSYSSLDGVLFDQNQTRLVLYPGGKAGTGYQIPRSVTTIGEGAFSSGSGGAGLTIPDNVTTLEPNAFFGCRDLTGVVLGDGVTSIPGGAFGSCFSLTNVTLSARVTSIEVGAFKACFGLVNFIIPRGVTSIGGEAFNDCTNLASFMVDAANAYYSSVDGVLFDKSQHALICYPAGRDATAYVIPDNVGYIGDVAFYACNRLVSVTLPDSLTGIGQLAFYGCTSLAGITIPRAVGIIDYQAFVQCPRLNRITVDEGNLFNASVDGVLFDKLRTRLVQYPEGKGDAAYAVPQGVDTIGESAFTGCTSLIALTIPNNVLTIFPGAFGGCTGLRRVYFDGAHPGFSGPTFYGTPATLYHLPGSSGWPDLIDGRPVVSWNPGILTGDGRLSVSAGHMGFTLSGAAGVPLVVEASEDLAHPNWVPVGTNTCDSEGLAQFSDPAGAGGPGLFYRFRPQ